MYIDENVGNFILHKIVSMTFCHKCYGFCVKRPEVKLEGETIIFLFKITFTFNCSVETYRDKLTHF